MSTPLKTPLTTAQKYAKINLTAEQRKEAHMRAMEILRECASGTPEWEPVCEPMPLPEMNWHLCKQVALPEMALSEVPQKAEDVVQVYDPVPEYKPEKQLKEAPFCRPLKTPITWGGSKDPW